MNSVMYYMHASKIINKLIIRSCRWITRLKYFYAEKGLCIPHVSSALRLSHPEPPPPPPKNPPAVWERGGVGSRCLSVKGLI